VVGFGYQRIAVQISLVFGIEIDKDVVRRVLARHYRPEPGFNGPSWLTFLGHSKDFFWMNKREGQVLGGLHHVYQWAA